MRVGWRGRSAPDRGRQVGLFRVSGSGLGNLFGLLLGLPSASTTYRHITGIRAGGQLAGDNNPINCSGYLQQYYCSQWFCRASPARKIPPALQLAPSTQPEQLFVRVNFPGSSAQHGLGKFFYLFVLTYNIEWDNVGLV